MSKTQKISQRKARMLRRRVNELESELTAARRQYRPGIGGDWLVSVPANAESKAMVSISVAEKLGFGIRAACGDGCIHFYAVKP